MVPDHDIKYFESLLLEYKNIETIIKYKKFSLYAYIDRNQNIRWCPNCSENKGRLEPSNDQDSLENLVKKTREYFQFSKSVIFLDGYTPKVKFDPFLSQD